MSRKSRLGSDAEAPSTPAAWEAVEGVRVVDQIDLRLSCAKLALLLQARVDRVLF